MTVSYAVSYAVSFADGYAVSYAVRTPTPNTLQYTHEIYIENLVKLY